MAETEDDVATDIAGPLDQGDESTAKPSASFSPMHGGSETLDSLHVSSATEPMGGASMHGGVGTEPLGPGFEVETDDATFARARAEVKASEAATVESLRRHATGFIEPAGCVDGLGIPPLTKGQNHGR